MPIISIQSSVVCGHVGNAAASFPLQRMGHEVWPVDTVSFNNHPRFGGWLGRVHEPCLICEIVTGINQPGAFARCEAVPSRYLGDPGTRPVVFDAVRASAAKNCAHAAPKRYP